MSPHLREMTEAEAIRRAQRGDGRAFERLYHQHKGRVYSLCLRMLGNTAEAEEMAQEAFLQLFRKIQTFRGESAFSTWLHRLAVSVVLMHRRKKRLPQVSLDEPVNPDEAGEGPTHDIGEEDPLLVGAIDRVTLENAIAQLSPGYRQVFLLYDVDGYEHNEIAEMMDCSIGNSKSQLHKARLRLRELLKHARRREIAGGQPMVGRALGRAGVAGINESTLRGRFVSSAAPGALGLSARRRTTMAQKGETVQLAKDAANIIPLARAVLCLDCEQITAAENRHCPACGSRAELLNVARALTTNSLQPQDSTYSGVAAVRLRHALRQSAAIPRESERRHEGEDRGGVCTTPIRVLA